MLFATLSNSRQSIHMQHERGPLEFGRGPQRDVERLVVEDRYTSRDQLLIEEIGEGRVRAQNLGGPIALSDGSTMPAGETRELVLPLRMTFGYTTLDLISGPAANHHDSSLRTIEAPFTRRRSAALRSLNDLGESPSPEILTRWFERLLAVQRAAAGSGEFYFETARAVVELVGLDCGLVLLLRDGEWQVVAAHPAESDHRQQRISYRVLRQVAEQKRTCFESFDSDSWTQSLAGVEAVVASPILDEHEAVVGTVYGTRDLRTAGPRRSGIQPLEAQVVQLLAAAVSSGLVRQQREAEAARTRVQFEQFFSPELAGALEKDPSLLEGQQREVTVLFSDLRGFSGLSEAAGARRTYALLSDVMDRFTNRIMENAGVVIDYYGDGLAAMWNAPTPQPDHVHRACCAALAMLEELPSLNQTWSAELGGEIRIGIGIHTGMAQVGNAGSKRRLKYGPRGHTVNLASRIEGSTKLLGIPCLVSEASCKLLPDKFARRRICRAQVTGIAEPINLFELVGMNPSENWCILKQKYEEALRHFEGSNFAECLKLCAELAGGVGQGDVPTMLLAQKSSAQLTAPASSFQSVYRLDTKS